jgi:Elongation factor Tu domain 2
MCDQGLNVALYWKNPDVRKFVNIVPTSAITGEGIPDMLQLLVKLTQVRKTLPDDACPFSCAAISLEIVQDPLHMSVAAARCSKCGLLLFEMTVLLVAEVFHLSQGIMSVSCLSADIKMQVLVHWFKGY